MKNNNKNPAWPLICGHMIECFDNTLYGFFAVMLGPIFFHTTSSSSSTLASFCAFSTGFVTRPIGAILFGFVGDRFGRRLPLYLSLLFVGVPTLGIGLTPAYEDIGILAPILLVFFRLIQGFLWGGEYAGANIYIAEGKNKADLGKRGATLISLGIMGAVIGSILGAIFTLNTMPVWAWRIPFILGGTSAFIVFFGRKNLLETEDFLHTKQPAAKLPLKDLFKNYKLPVLTTLLISGVDLMPAYFVAILGNVFYREFGFSFSQSMLLNSLSFGTIAIMVLFTGRLGDRIGFHRQLTWVTLFLAFISIPSFWFISHGNVSVINVVIFILLLSLSGSFISSVYVQYVIPFFPVSCRYSGVAISVTVGQALFGGTVPIIGQLLTNWFQTRLAPAFWLCFVSLMACFLMHLNMRQARKKVLEENNPLSVNFNGQALERKVVPF